MNWSDRLSCCCPSGSTSSTSPASKTSAVKGDPSAYRPVQTADDVERPAPSKKTVSIEEPVNLSPVYTELHFTAPPSQQDQKPKPETVYANVSRNPAARDSDESSEPPLSPVYAEVHKSKPQADVTFDSVDTPTGSPYQPKNRKSYIPIMYQTETPTNQTLGAVNAQLKDALKVKKLETTDDL